ncbi:nucleotide pyrophosphohydrolase [Thiohalomonas denitrificans]|uniref:nucleotide pyrophosphohydrolase n=1 Tax=Thiohalomonas denitrificans TaxID=415747 RepID=UPI0026F1C63B|nr:nucleotide pyrophosphohydrolase [Thiohalomonas denitrificans]
MTDSIDKLKQRLRRFAEERDWEQFHSPKNLSMALIAEAAELVEHFQWLTEAQSAELAPEKQREVELELADIFIFLIRCADRLGVDLVKAANEKTDINEGRFPVERVRGVAGRGSDFEP